MSLNHFADHGARSNALTCMKLKSASKSSRTGFLPIVQQWYVIWFNEQANDMYLYDLVVLINYQVI